MAAHTPWAALPGESTQAFRARTHAEVRARLQAGETPAFIQAALGRPAAPLPPSRAVTEAELAALQADAATRAASLEGEDSRRYGDAGANWFNAGPRAVRSVGSALPANVRAASGLRVGHLRIKEADIKPIARETPAAKFRAAAEAAIVSFGLKGFGISAKAVEKFVDKIIAVEMRDRVGFARRTLRGWRTLTRYCERHCQRVLKWLEASGLLDVLNTLLRDADGYWVRGANIYVPTIDAEPWPLPADVNAPDPLLPAVISRALGAASRLGALFGLAVRPGGLNVTPLRARHSPA
jgi:hypothetical protein